MSLFATKIGIENRRSSLLPRYLLECLHGECDLVVCPVSTGTARQPDLHATAGGDIDLRLFNGYTSGNRMSNTFDWRFTTVRFKDETGAFLGATHTLAAQVARGYRVVVLNEQPTTPEVYSFTVDPETDWAVSQVWCANSADVTIRFEIYDDLASAVVDTADIASGSAQYLSLVGNTDSTPRMRIYYYDSGISDWRLDDTSSFFIGDLATVPHPAFCIAYNNSGTTYDVYADTYLPWPHTQTLL